MSYIQNGQARTGISHSGLSRFGKRTCKPNSVVCGHSSRRRVAADAHQRPTRRFRHLHEAPQRRKPVAGDPARAAWAHRADTQRRLALSGSFPPYLVLLRVGFTLPPALQSERCALAAPFHPYPGAGRPAEKTQPALRGDPGRDPKYVIAPGGSRGGIFSVALAVYGPSSPHPGRYPAHCPAEFGLSSPGQPACANSPAATARSSCHDLF